MCCLFRPGRVQVDLPTRASSIIKQNRSSEPRDPLAWSLAQIMCFVWAKAHWWELCFLRDPSQPCTDMGVLNANGNRPVHMLHINHNGL